MQNVLTEFKFHKKSIFVFMTQTKAFLHITNSEGLNYH